MHETATDTPLIVPFSKACALTGCGKTKGFELINEGKWKARKQGSRTMIETASLREYVESLPAVTPRPKKEAA